MKKISFCSNNLERYNLASVLTIEILSWNFAMFDLMRLIESWDESIRVTSSAPLDIASIPNAPVPANKSITFALGTLNWIILKIVSLTLSVVGRMLSPLKSKSFLPLYFPAITLISYISLYLWLSYLIVCRALRLLNYVSSVLQMLFLFYIHLDAFA